MVSNTRGGKDRLNAQELLFVRAFCDPTNPKTFNNGAGAARAAGYPEKRARKKAWKLLRRPKVREAIRELRARVAELLALDQAAYIEKLLDQADAWLDPETGRPKQQIKRYFHQGEELAVDRLDVMPGMAQLKALELVGQLLGHVPDGRERDEGERPTVYVVAMPVKAQSAEEWMERYREQLGLPPPGREIEAGPSTPDSR